MVNSQTADYPGPRVDLPMDRKLARQIISSAPAELLKMEVSIPLANSFFVF
jgi:hypothetical protein